MCPLQKTLRKTQINGFVLQLWMSTNLGLVRLREKNQSQVFLPSAQMFKAEASALLLFLFCFVFTEE